MTALRTCLRWLAALVVCALPAFAFGETFTFKNDCKDSLVVQIATVQRGVLKREQVMLKPGEETAKMPLTSDKTIIVVDGKTGRMMFRDVLKTKKTPQSFNIIPHPRMPGQVAMKPVPLPKGEPPPKRDR